MKRLCAVVVSIAAVVPLLVFTPGSALAYTRTAQNQRAVDAVIARAMSQRGVPFTYGGGDVNGPSRGVARAVTSAPDTATGLSAAPLPNPAAGLPGFTAVSPSASSAATAVVPDAAAAQPPSDVVGFDASGLMVYAYAGVGVKLPRSSGEQYKAGLKVTPDQALPGDLLFYGPDGTQSVALFTGNGQMVETTDTGVAVSSVRTADMAPYLVRIIA